jgi:hypothetical protein
MASSLLLLRMMHFGTRGIKEAAAYSPGQGLDEWRAQTLLHFLARHLVEVRNDLDRLTGDEQDGDGHEGYSEANLLLQLLLDWLLLLMRWRRLQSEAVGRDCKEAKTI